MNRLTDQLPDAPLFRVEHVRLPPDRQVGLHQQSAWELSYVITGAGDRTVGTVSEPFGSGEVVLVPPGMPHHWHFHPDCTDADGRIENISVTFRDELLDRTAQAYPMVLPLIQRLRELPMSLLFTHRTARRLAQLLTDMALQPPAVQLFQLLQAVVLVASSDERRVVGYFTPTLAERRLHDIEAYISCNFRRQLTLADLARHVGMNQTSLCKFIKRQLGRTFVEYLNARRMAEARYLLRQRDLTVAQVCYRSGFNDVPHFCRTFKRLQGLTPKQYRELSAQ